MTIGLIDSGLGSIPTAGWIRCLDRTCDVVLALDPQGAPWGPKSAEYIVDRVLYAAAGAVRHGARVLVLACNTASVTVLDVLRREFEPQIPVIGTVPAIKPAARAGRPFAVWATRATTDSHYQDELIRCFAPGQDVTRIVCHGLAEAVDSGDLAAIDAAIERAVAQTPAYCASVVLGCTHYPLVADRIQARLPGTALLDTALAVARQALRRLAAAVPVPRPGTGRMTVLLSGETGQLPAAAHGYPLTSALLDGRMTSRQLLPSGASGDAAAPDDTALAAALVLGAGAEDTARNDQRERTR